MKKIIAIAILMAATAANAQSWEGHGCIRDFATDKIIYCN